MITDLILYDFDYVESWLEEAGRVEFAHKVPGCFPAGYQSSMPETVKDRLTDYADNDAPGVVPQPTMMDLKIRDQVERWIEATKYRNHQKVMKFRMLIDPRNDRIIMSWRRIARRMHINDKTAKRWYELGLSEIVGQLNTGKLSPIIKGEVQ